MGPPAAPLGQTLPTSDAAGQPRAASPPQNPLADLSRTMVGHAAPDHPPPQPPPAAAPPAGGAQSLKSTMLGIAPLPARGGAPQASPGPTPAAGLRGTMLGIAPIVPGPPGSSAPVPPVAPETQPSHPFGGTLPSAQPGAPPVSDLAGSKKTMLGIARPGIAPLHPGILKPEPAPPAPAAPPVPFGPPAETPASEPLPPADTMPESRRVPVLAAVAIVGAGALLAAAGVGLFLYQTRGEIEARVVSNETGQEEIVLRCPRCESGTTVRLGRNEAKFSDGQARLGLERPLAIGENALSFELERRRGKSETVELNVPVEYRVRGDTSGLSEAPPLIRIQAEALPGSSVALDGKPVPLYAGKGAVLPLDVSEQLTGPGTSVSTLERRVPYTITPPGSPPQTGEVVVRLGITPLVVLAPGESLVIDTPTFVLAGRTAKNGAVSVEGRPITVDAAGNFAQVMGVSSAGETVVTVRATLPDHAPRLVPIKIRRVASLVEEAARLRPLRESSYSELTRTMDRRGLEVALDGSVFEARADTHSTVLLMEVKSGCKAPPCLARVSVGAKSSLAAGDPVSVFGTLTGAVEGPRTGTKIPAVAAEFVLKGRP